MGKIEAITMYDTKKGRAHDLIKISDLIQSNCARAKKHAVQISSEHDHRKHGEIALKQEKDRIYVS